MKTISRDGKRRRPRKGDPVFVFDSQGRRRIVPRLEDVYLRFRWSKFGSGMDLFYVWRGKEHLFHTLFRFSEWRNRKEQLTMDAAKMFCIEEYDAKQTEKKKAPRCKSVVNTVFKMWLNQLDAWRPALTEAEGLVKLREVMES